MKRTILFLALCLVPLWLSAQTCHNGTWYALYDDTEHAMNTQGDYETGGIFAPVAGTLNVQWRYEWIDWLGVARKIDTRVQESADGGSNVREVGELAENTDKNSNTTEQFAVSRNINWIKFDRSGLPTHKVIVYHMDMPLAQHILFPSGSYGASETSVEFGELLKNTASEGRRVSLRSFLSAGDITVTSSEPEIFRVGAPDNTDGIVYAVGANACASANGSADAAAAGVLGNIDSYAFDLYFTPREAQNYTADITLTDGVSTAVVHVSGTGTAPLVTYYSYEREVCEGETYVDEHFGELAEAGVYVDTVPSALGGDSVIELTLSVHPVYLFEEDMHMHIGDSEEWQQTDLSLFPAGDTTLVASYLTVAGCDSTYVLHLSVRPRITTYGNDTIVLCSGEEALYDGNRYRRSTVDSVLLRQTNMFGGDSIVELVVIVYPVLRVVSEMTVTEGEQLTWQDYNLGDMPVGDTTLVVQYVSVHGCDSTYVLNLSVRVEMPDGLDRTEVTDGTPDKQMRNGMLFIRKGDAWYDLLGRRLK